MIRAKIVVNNVGEDLRAMAKTFEEENPKVDALDAAKLKRMADDLRQAAETLDEGWRETILHKRRLSFALSLALAAYNLHHEAFHDDGLAINRLLLEKLREWVPIP